MMKRYLSLIAVLTLFINILCVTDANAKENNKKTAYEIKLNQPATGVIEGENECELWFKFVAPTSDYYEFENLNADIDVADSYLTIYDQDAEDEYDDLGCEDIDDYTGRCRVAAKLKKGRTYYIVADNFVYDDGRYECVVAVKKHTHALKLYAYKDSHYVDYDCKICEYSKTGTISASLSASSYTYDGKVKTPSVNVKNTAGIALKKNEDYTLRYASGRKNVGTYKVTVQFKNSYDPLATITKTFKINPKGTSLTTLTRKSKGFSIKWKKNTVQTTGYQIQYSTSAKFTTATTKTVTITNSKTTSKTMSKLKSNKKYYVRIRTYKTVGKTKYYSSWSKAKSVTTKK